MSNLNIVVIHGSSQNFPQNAEHLLNESIHPSYLYAQETYRL